MRVQFENVDFSSRSGPNGFGLKLARQLSSLGHEVTGDMPDVQLTFIQGMNTFRPNVLRLDGIYFNSAQAWQEMNAPIRASYEFADAVIVQSEFDRRLTETYFGCHPNTHVIRNGTDTQLIRSIPAALVGGRPREAVWMCASAWRPHKRLSDCIKLFLEMSRPNDVLLVAGKDAGQNIDPDIPLSSRIVLLGDLPWDHLVSCMKSSGHFIHLAWLDHCPNVVIDARAAGCRIYCSSAGGTAEIAGENAVVVREEEWDMQPTRLYEPPRIDFSNIAVITGNPYFARISANVDISPVAQLYINIMESVISLGKVDK